MLDSEMPVAYKVVDRKARKSHTCCECRGIIDAGEVYRYHSGVWDGKGASFKMCVDCDELRDELFEIMEDGIAFGDLSDAICYDEEDNPDMWKRFEAIVEKRKGN